MASIQKRESKKGKVTYRVQIRTLKYRETATFERQTDAKRWAAQVETAIANGRHFKDQAPSRHTFAEMVDRYIAEVMPTKPKSESAQVPQLLWWRSQVGEKSLADVTPALLSELRDALSKKGRRDKPLTPASVNRYLAALSHVFTVATEEWQWLSDSPTRLVRRMKEPRGRTRFLSDEERERLLEACRASGNIYLYPAVVLALSTGMRSGEIMNLTLDDVDLTRKRLILRETKNGEQRAVPLAAEALGQVREVVGLRRPDDTRLLFPSDRRLRPGTARRPIELRAPWNTALAKAGLKDFKFHDLRHTAASYLAMCGASLMEISAVLGHKTLQMVKRYSHLSDPHTATVVTRMNQRIFGQSTKAADTSTTEQVENVRLQDVG